VEQVVICIDAECGCAVFSEGLAEHQQAFLPHIPERLFMTN
jgi:hypothetical protein